MEMATSFRNLNLKDQIFIVYFIVEFKIKFADLKKKAV